MRILGIETSCDETGVAVYDTQHGLLGHNLYSQVKLHADYGGVVPELASRDHIRKLYPLVAKTMQDSQTRPQQLAGVAYTRGPGLVGALLVGSSFARSLGYGWQLPVLGVHHMEGHILALMLDDPAPDFPFVALLVSGGHSMLVKATGIGQYDIMGETLDDAAGEAFDKTAKLLGLDYPGGPALAKLADIGVAGRFTFPRPMTDRPGLDLSFSGLKTYAARTVSTVCSGNPSGKLSWQDKADIALAFQTAVVETLAIKCRRAVRETGLTRLVIAGGVGANSMLRQQLQVMMQAHGGRVYYPRPAFCTDNGAMIAYAGAQRFLAGETSPWSEPVLPRWSLDELPAITPQHTTAKAR